MAKSLIPVSTGIINNESVPTVDARALHTFLEVDTRFNDWMKDRIETYGFLENRDYVGFTEFPVKPQGGRPSKEYSLTLDMAKELSMVERNEKGKQARRYFIRCEKQMLTHQKPPSTGLPQFRQARAIDIATKAAERIFSNLPSLGDESKQAIYANLINPIAEREIVPLPVLAERTYTATEVGKRLGISAHRVGTIANTHHLKTPENGRVVLDKASHSDKQVETFRYNEQGIEAVRRFMPPPALPTSALVEVRP